MLVADSHEQSMQRGEFQHWIRCGGDKDKIWTLDQVAATADLQRKERNDGLIIFDSSGGTALEDATVTVMVLEALTYPQTETALQAPPTPPSGISKSGTGTCTGSSCAGVSVAMRESAIKSSIMSSCITEESTAMIDV
jgi:hypothetical protein